MYNQKHPNHLYLRKFKERDKVTIGRCIAHKIPFGPAKIKDASINDMIQEVDNEYTLIIADKMSGNLQIYFQQTFGCSLGMRIIAHLLQRL